MVNQPWVFEQGRVLLPLSPSTFPELSAPRPLPKPSIPHPTALDQTCPATPPPFAMHNGGNSQHQLPEEGTGGHHPGGLQERQEAALPLGRAPGCLGRFAETQDGCHLPDCEPRKRGLRLPPGLARQRPAVQGQGINDCHS